MTIRVPLPPDRANPDGNWADLRTGEDLTGADQDAYFDAYDSLIALQPKPEPQPDPANPAVLLPAPPPRLSNAGGRALRDRLLSILVVAWSYDHIPLPYTSECRGLLPVLACNALAKASLPIERELTGAEDEDEDGDAPKPGEPSGAGGSTDTSPAGTPSLLPVPPAAPSSTPAG